MARIRTIKPEFFTSEDIVALSPMARLLYVALWCEADRDGRLEWKPRTFKMRYLPADECDVDALCDELLGRGLVMQYGIGLAFIPTFSEHQHVNPREAPSRLPAPPPVEELTRGARVSDASARVQAPSVTRREEGKGREGKGRELVAGGKLSLTPDAPASEPKPRKLSEAERFFLRCQDERQTRTGAVPETIDGDDVPKLRAWFKRACDAVGTDAEARLFAAWQAYLLTKNFADGKPWSVFTSDKVWRGRVPPRAVTSTPSSEDAPIPVHRPGIDPDPYADPIELARAAREAANV